MSKRTRGQLVTRGQRPNRSWSARYADAEGKRVQERLGREREGMTPQLARKRLEAFLHDVDTKHRKRQQPVTLERFAREWIDKLDELEELKRSTRAGYRVIIEKHLAQGLGRHRLDAIDADKLDDYIATKRKAGLGPRTINRHLNLLHKLYVVARKRKLARSNPVEDIERPRDPDVDQPVMTPVEIGAVLRAFGELEQNDWTRQARVVFLTMIGTGMRRGEIRGLRWKDVALADPAGARLHVCRTWLLGAEDTPKSKAARRMIGLDDVVAAGLFDHRARTRFDGDDEFVFCNPQTGGPLDPGRYSVTHKAVLKRAKVDKPLRPFHGIRHSALTNDAASGMSPAALIARAGHSSFKTTQGYIHLAGELFSREVEQAAARKYGHVQAPTEAPRRS